MSTDTIKETTVDILQDLLTRAYDAEQGYQSAAEHVQHFRLAELFKEYAQQRIRFGKDIKSHIRSLGEEPDKGASMTGKLHQMWISLRGKLSEGNEADILEECMRGEETTMSDYREYIDEPNLSEDVRSLLRDQLSNIEVTYGHLKQLDLKAENLAA